MKENILLIGCDISSQQLITDELKQAGYQINTSANSTEFEQFLAKSHPDLILLNYPIHSSYSKELQALINTLLNKNAQERPSVA